MSGLRGNSANLRKLATALRQLPKTLAIEVAAAVAPEVTTQAQAAFDGGRNVYGDARPAGADGRTLSLVRTGAARKALVAKSVGTIVRFTAGTARYIGVLIGKYKILPAGGSPMPVAWQDAAGKIARAKIDRRLAGAL